MWGRNKKAGSEEERREVSSEGGYTTTGEAVEGASNLYTEICAGKEDEVL